MHIIAFSAIDRNFHWGEGGYIYPKKLANFCKKKNHFIFSIISIK